MAGCPVPGRGAGWKAGTWLVFKRVLMRRFLGQGGQDDFSFPEGFPFSLREGDEDRAVTPSVLGDLLERSITDAHGTGTVYTPRFLVRWMARETVSRWMDFALSASREKGREAERALLKRIRVLDLSAGSGAFTMGILHELVRRRKILEPECSEAALVRAAVEDHIYGADVCAEALDVARFRFRYALLAAGDDAPFRDHLICGDSLDLFGAGVRRDVLARVMKEGGFDLVIGNPPFIGEKGNKELFDRLKASRMSAYCSSRMDYWYVFACLGMDVLKPGGVMHLVVPNKWMANAGAAPLRRKLLEECGALRLSDFGARRVFESARVHTMTLLAERKNHRDEALVPEYRRFSAEPEHVEEFLINAPYRRFPLPKDRSGCVEQGLFFCSAAEKAVLEKMEARRNFELNPVHEMAQGIVPNPDVVSSRALGSLPPEIVRSSGIRRGEGVFVVPREFFTRLPERERCFLKPLYEPVLAERYGLKEPEKVLLYLTPENGSERARTLIRHLEKFRSLMEARRETRMGRMKYYHVHWPRKENFFLPGPKILAVRKCARPTFTHTEREAYVMMSFNVIRTERLSMKYLAALFNSRLMHFWFRLRGKMQGDFFQMDTAPILRAPVHVPSASVVTEVERLSDALVEHYCPEWDERMNELIERIYGISAEEREVIVQAVSPAPGGKGNRPE